MFQSDTQHIASCSLINFSSICCLQSGCDKIILNPYSKFVEHWSIDHYRRSMKWVLQGLKQSVLICIHFMQVWSTMAMWDSIIQILLAVTNWQYARIHIYIATLSCNPVSKYCEKQMHNLVSGCIINITR